MTDALLWHRIQFAFSITFHYLFPQLTMGLALLIVLFKSLAIRRGDEQYNDVARFWARIFGLNFAMGVVTGIPLEFQFGTNWARFSSFAGEIIGQTLAMEGVFAFFLESSFLGLFLYGEKRLGPRGHLAAAVALFLGSWLSGYFIIVTNAFMQHPVGHGVAADGTLRLVDFGAFVEILPGKDGLCHISELSDEYVNSVGDVCRVGDEMQVKVIAIDEQEVFEVAPIDDEQPALLVAHRGGGARPGAEPQPHGPLHASGRAGRRFLAQDVAGGDFRIESSRFIDMHCEPEAAGRSGGFVGGEIREVGDFDFARAEREAHRRGREHHIGGEQRDSEDDEFAHAEDAGPDLHQ
jgi:hypothetical protein